MDCFRYKIHHQHKSYQKNKQKCTKNGKAQASGADYYIVIIHREKRCKKSMSTIVKMTE